MKLTIQITTSKEEVSEYEGDGEKKKYVTRLLNPADRNRIPENINVQIADFNFEGSIKPLLLVITTFFEQYIAGENEKKHLEIAKMDTEKMLSNLKKVKKDK